MPLIRTTQTMGNRILFPIPSQLAEAYDISEGDALEIIPLDQGSFKVRKARSEPGGTP